MIGYLKAVPDAELDRLVRIMNGESEGTLPPLINPTTLTDEEMDIYVYGRLTDTLDR